MLNFQSALISSQKNPIIPDEHDIYSFLIGSWSIAWITEPNPKHMNYNAQWHFARVLDGMAIQDVFVSSPCADAPQGEYGSTLRMYNPSKGVWDVFYVCSGANMQLESCQENNSIVQTDVSTRLNRWVFDNITESSFEWIRYLSRDGMQWNVVARMHAVRNM